MQKRKTAWALALLLTLLPVGTLAAGETPTENGVESQGEAVAQVKYEDEDGNVITEDLSLGKAVAKAIATDGTVQLLKNTDESVAVTGSIEIRRISLDGTATYSASNLTAGTSEGYNFVRVTTDEAYTFYPEGINLSSESTGDVYSLTVEYSSAAYTAGTLYVAAYNGDGKMLAVDRKLVPAAQLIPNGDGIHVAFSLDGFVRASQKPRFKVFLLDTEKQAPLIQNTDTANS